MKRVEQDFNPEGVTYAIPHTRDRRVIREALTGIDTEEHPIAGSILSKMDSGDPLSIEASDIPFVVRAVGLYAHDLGDERSVVNTKKRAERLVGAMVVASARDFNQPFTSYQ